MAAAGFREQIFYLLHDSRILEFGSIGEHGYRGSLLSPSSFCEFISQCCFWSYDSCTIICKFRAVNGVEGPVAIVGSTIYTFICI